MPLGRTTRMIQSLPADGAVIVVADDRVRIDVLRSLLELRGPDFDRLCDVVVSDHDSLQALGREKRAVVFDHTFWRMAPSEVKDLARALFPAPERPSA